VDVLFFLLALAAFIMLIIGLVKPSLVVWWKKKTRWMALASYGGLTLLFLILFGATASDQSSAPSSSSSNNTTASTSSSHSAANSTNSTAAKSQAETSHPSQQQNSSQTADSSAALAFLDSLQNLDPPVTVSDKTKQLVQEHPQWFPAKSGDTSYKSHLTHVSSSLLHKNPTRYAGDLIRISGTVTQIRQYNDPTWALMIIEDEDGNIDTVAYNGDTGNIVENDYVTVVGTPICEWDFQNLMNGYTPSVLFDGVSITKNGSGSSQ
jgi:hypothetical protein